MKKIFWCLLLPLVLLVCLSGCGEEEEPLCVVSLRGFLTKFYVELDSAALKEVTRATHPIANQVLFGLRNDKYYPKLALGFDITGLTYTLTEGGKANETKASIEVSGKLLVKTAEDPAGRSMDVKFPVLLYLNRDQWEVDFTHDFFQYSTIDSGEQLGIVAGPKGSTEYMMALDLRMLGKRTGLNVYVHEGKNAEDRIMAIKDSSDIQVGFVQQDALLYIQSGLSKIPLIQEAAKEMRALFPLYADTVQIVGGRRIKSLQQFTGRIVSVGTPESSSFITGNLIFYMGGVATHSLLAAGGEQALSAFKREKVDGMLQTGVVPQPDFLKLDPEMRIALVPVETPALQELYTVQEIPAGSYPWQNQAVSSVGVSMVLATRDYTGSTCKVIGYFADVISENMDWLRANGEARWKEVQLDAPLTGWLRYDCVDKVMREEKGRYQ